MQGFVLFCFAFIFNKMHLHHIDPQPKRLQRPYCNLLSKKERKEGRGEGREGENKNKNKTK